MSKFTLKPLSAAFLCMVFVGTNVYAVESPVSIKASQVTEWKFKTKKPVVATPVIAGNLVYVGGEDGSFYALDAESGKQIWRYVTPNRITSTAVIDKKTIVFESGNILYALDKKGNLSWKTELSEPGNNDQIDPWDFHHSSPVIHEGVVYIGSENGVLQGVNLRTGVQTYRCETGNKDAVRTTPVIYNNNVLFGDWEGVFYACNLKNGEVNWKYDTRKDVVYGWKNSIHGTPYIYKDAVYFAGRSSRLYCLDVKTGTKKWLQNSPTDQWLLGGPIVKDNVVYIGSSDQYLFQAFDAGSGKQLWQVNTDGRTWGAPNVGKRGIYIAARSLYLIDKSGGRVLEKIGFEQANPDRHFGEYADKLANMHSSPQLYRNRIIVGSDDGYIYALAFGE